MAPFEDKPLFSLIPLTFSAQKIVHANSEYAKSFNGKPCLSFKAGHKSRLPGKLVSFGSCVGINDILLPYTAFLEFVKHAPWSPQSLVDIPTDCIAASPLTGPVSSFWKILQLATTPL